MENLETKLTIEQQEERIKLARNYKTAWEFETIPTEFSISSDTAKKFGYIENKDMYRKSDNKGNKLDGFFVINNNCPVCRNEEQALIACKTILGKSFLDLVNSAIKTLFDNTCRAYLNRAIESKKALERLSKQEKALEIQALVAEGKIDVLEAMKRMASLIQQKHLEQNSIAKTTILSEKRLVY